MISANSTNINNLLASYNWILDSGAKNHITYNADLLSNSELGNSELGNSVLHLPNNTIVPITHIGSDVISSTITL